MKLCAPGSGGNSTPRRTSRFTMVGLRGEVMVVRFGNVQDVQLVKFQYVQLPHNVQCQAYLCAIPHNTPSTHKVEENKLSQLSHVFIENNMLHHFNLLLIITKCLVDVRLAKLTCLMFGEKFIRKRRRKTNKC